MSLAGTKLRSLPGSVSLVGELGLPASPGCVPGPGQCMGPGGDPHVGTATESACRGSGSMPPFLAVLRSGQLLGKERCLTELNQTASHLKTRESPVAGPVQALHLWPVSLGLLAPVATGRRWPSGGQSPAGAGAGHGVLPALLVHLGPCPSPAPSSAGLSGDVVAAPCSWQGHIDQNSLLGRGYLAPLVLERKLQAGRTGSGGG